MELAEKLKEIINALTEANFQNVEVGQSLWVTLVDFEEITFNQPLPEEIFDTGIRITYTETGSLDGLKFPMSGEVFVFYTEKGWKISEIIIPDEFYRIEA